MILHTSDLHTVLPRAAVQQLASLKRAHPGALLLDAGDALKAGNLAFHSAGEPVLGLMAEAGYDAMAMGNRESHPLRQALARKLKDATFPILSANLEATRGRPPAVVQPSIIFERAGRRIAVFGLTVPITPPKSAWAHVTSFVFHDPVETAGRVAPELKQQADLVVCLSHCGYKTEERLAEIPEVDLVLGGHSHKLFVQQEPGKAMIVAPGKYASHVSRTELRSREQVSSELIPLEKEP